MTTVATTLALLAALKIATAGSTISLAPGDYHSVNIANVKKTVTIESADPKHLAVLHDLKVDQSSGLTFKNLDLDTSQTTPNIYGGGATNVFFVLTSSHITFTGLTVHGSPTGTLANTVSAFLIRSSDHVTVANSDFSHLHSALAHLDDTYLKISGNAFHHLWDDAIRGGGSSWVTIDSNHCYSNHPDISDTDHPDCIQFWTKNTTTTAHDFTITNNRYERGTGTGTQFIFFGNEASVQYANILIRGNVAYGSQWNGIRVTDAKNVQISNNSLVASCVKEYGQVMIPWIATQSVSGLTVTNNIVAAINPLGGDTNVVERGNVVNKTCR